ncbi:MAG: hypothetical protein V4547_11325 [Bacteroidota bacterium]
MKHAKNIFWLAFIVFVVSAIYFNWNENIFSFSNSLGIGKLIIWLAFFGFTIYTYYCSKQEDPIKSFGKIIGFHWGRQVGVDLYLGLFLSLFTIYLNEGSVVVLLLWFFPTILFANLSTLLYFAIHYDVIVTKLLGA